MFGRYCGGHFVRPVLPARCPQHHQVAAFDHLDGQQRKVGRLNQVAIGQQFLLNFVELVARQTHRRKYRLPAGIAILANHHIAAPQIFEIIGKGADRAQDGIRIPARLVLDALALDGALPQQVIEIDGQLVRHLPAPRNLARR